MSRIGTSEQHCFHPLDTQQARTYCWKYVGASWRAGLITAYAAYYSICKAITEIMVDMSTRSWWTFLLSHGGPVYSVMVDMSTRSWWTCLLGHGGHIYSVMVDMSTRT